MSRVLDAQGYTKLVPAVHRGFICAYSGIFSGNRLPTGWGLCDGTNGTPDLRGAFVLGASAVGAGTPGGTEQIDEGLTHSGFALTNHSNHVVGQPSAHSDHSPTQPSAHSNHIVTQPATHSTHSSEGAHTHDAHVNAGGGSAAVATNKLIGPGTHSSDGAHTHDAHPAHAGWTVDAHSAHSGFAVTAHSAHSGWGVDAHGAHVVTQGAAHYLKHCRLVYIMKT